MTKFQFDINTLEKVDFATFGPNFTTAEAKPTMVSEQKPVPLLALDSLNYIFTFTCKYLSSPWSKAQKGLCRIERNPLFLLK